MEQQEATAKLQERAERLVYDDNPVVALAQRIDGIFSRYQRERTEKLRRIARFLCEHIPASVEHSLTANVVYSDRNPERMRREATEENFNILSHRMREMRSASGEALDLLLEGNPLGSWATMTLLGRYHIKGSTALDTLRFIRLIPAEDISQYTRDSASFDTLMNVLDFLRLRRDHLQKTGRHDDSHDAGLAAAVRFLIPSKHYKYVDADLLDFVFQFPDKVGGVEQYLTDFRRLITDEVDFDHLMGYLSNDNAALREGML